MGSKTVSQSLSSVPATGELTKSLWVGAGSSTPGSLLSHSYKMGSLFWLPTVTSKGQDRGRCLVIREEERRREEGKKLRREKNLKALTVSLKIISYE